ncbi:hypothetical protein [uncultured Actinomyces sp.]|jgi:hypothetical protein|uniref:hypothetical protein n=1 Tax=uncultured Actinomyces sp. TaxID=249061 RepID=UPI0028E3218B|nr:hypothetical protein [uncultured Actinomyces sp.]
MDAWRTPIEVSGPAIRDEDGYLVRSSKPRLIAGCLVAPGVAATPGLLVEKTSMSPTVQATVYAPPSTRIEVGEVVRVPDAHPCGGVWTVEAPPAAWPRGVVVPLVRR